MHYNTNNQDVQDGELVLIDLGSANEHYCADISRTFPVNGKFTERQKEVYNIVLGAQQLVIDNARPGMTYLDLNNMVIKYYEEELPKIGLLKDGKEQFEIIIITASATAWDWIAMMLLHQASRPFVQAWLSQ